MNLLGDDSDEEDQRLKINKRFAAKYESRERTKELARAKEADDDDDESDSESEDDDAELATSAMDVQIVKTINMIRKKDPKIYDKETAWFQQQQDDDDDDDDDDTNNKKDTKKKKKLYKDVLREQLLKHGPDIEGDDSVQQQDMLNPRDRKGLAYDAEQERIRREFLETANEDDDDDDEVLKVRVKSAAERADDEAELKAALEEMKTLGKAKKDDTEKRDAFLLDYISQQKWKSDQFSFNAEDDDDDYEKDEEELDNVDMFESKYNFRFEELQGSKVDGDDDAGALRAVQVTGHSRNVDGSVRRVDDKRKKQRESRKELKEKERRQKEAELRRLKNLKKEELQSRLQQISEIGGLKEMGIDEAVLEEDWDPEKYEAMMQKQFGSDYYDQDDDGNFVEQDEAEFAADAADAEEEAYHEGYDEEGDGDEVPKKKAPLAAPTANGGAGKMFDELYKFDYEDIVAGMPTRFKYRQVAKEDFGLSAEEILLADDVELNQFVSLKKISAYRDQGKDGESSEPLKVAKKRKRLRVLMKERLQKEAEEAAAAGKTLKGVDKGKHKQAEEPATVAEGGEEDGDAPDEAQKKRRRRHKASSSAPSAPSAAQPAESSTSEPEATEGAEVPVVKQAERKHHKPQKDHRDKKKSKKSGGKGDAADSKQRRMNLYD